MNQRLSRPGGSGAGSELGFKAGYGGQRDEWRHTESVALQLVEENRHEVGIELRAAQPAKLVGCPLMRLRRLVRPAVDHRLVGVGNGDDARAERDVLAAQPVGVAGAIEALVVVANDRREGARGAQRTDDLLADLR